MALLAMVGMARADKVFVNDITLPQGGNVVMAIGYEFNSGITYKGFQLEFSLPEGVNTLKDDDGLPVATAGSALDDHGITAKVLASGAERYIVTSFNNKLLKGTEGTLFSVTLHADDSLEVGSCYEVTLNEVTFTTADIGNAPFENATFTITIGEPADTRVVIDEAATALPEAATGVDVRVKRTIKAGEWSTICLPFAMTEAQVKEVFGNDVQLLDFDDYEVQDDGNSINLSFNAINSIEANHPCVIKVTEPVSEFIVDGVDVDPEEEPMINKGTKRKPRAIIGNYVAGTLIENGCLFLSGNEFWYSVGKTKIKGLRAYFNFDDLLPEFEDNYAESRMHFVINSETDGISDVSLKASTDACYDLQGRKVADGQQKRGIYVKQGKKMVVK